MALNIVVTSSSHLPRFCAGVSFVGTTAFPADRFTAAQLRELLADRLLTVVVGQVLTPADVDAFVAGAGGGGEPLTSQGIVQPIEDGMKLVGLGDEKVIHTPAGSKWKAGK